MRRSFFILLVAIAAAHSRPAAGQYQVRTWLQWHTVETQHFSVHYPTELEPWAISVASKMEGIDSVVRRIVGHTTPRRVNMVIDDPFGISNGSAWPFLEAPAIVLWATPPDPRDDIGTYVTWADMVASHEFTHIAHLTWPSRNAADRALWRLLPVDLGPIARDAPRWVIEGYATYAEGLVTGSGRPHGVWRPTILRQWALEGHLPSYEQLSDVGGMYGGEFAYLGGSAFIEWLAQRRGDSSLVNLWRRMSAKEVRSFDDAFVGVYGEPPSILYGRFAAELTGGALQTRAALLTSASDSGRVIQHLGGETGDPAISSDGGRVALMVKPAERAGRIVIWKTIDEPDTLAERRRQQLAKSDPQDVPAIRVFPPPKRARATLYAVAGQSYQGPRFFRDGRVLVWRPTAVGDGSYVPDLYVWDPQRGKVKRLTRAANVRQGDPSPDGSRIAALRCAAGHCDLVLVDSRSGTVSTVASGSDARSFYRPRFSPDGRNIVASVHDNGIWSLATITADGGAVSFITTGTNVYDAAFAGDSTIVATAELGRVPTLVKLRLGASALQPLVGVTGAAVGADVNPADHTAWFLALHSRGWDLRATPVNRPAELVTTADAFTVRGDSQSSAHLLAATSPGTPHRYGSGPRKWIYVPGFAWSDEGASVVAALVNSDIVGRHELLFQMQAGTRSSWHGGSAALTSRTSRAPWTVAGFSVRQDNVPITTVLHGGSLTIEATHRVETSFRRLVLGGTLGDVQSAVAPAARRQLALATLAAGATSFNKDGRTSIQVSASGASGSSDGSSVQRGVVTAVVQLGPNPLMLSGTLGQARTSSRFEQFTLGGVTPALLHPDVLSQRVSMPVLPPTYASGTSLRIYRASIPFGSGRLYSWNAKVQGDSASRWERVAGLEWTFAFPQVSVIGTPAGRLTAGAGDWLNAPRSPSIELNGVTYRPRQRSRIQLYVMTQFGDWVR